MDLKTALAETIAAAAGLPAGEVLEMRETPPDPKMGDAALPCFKLAKELRKAPPVIAQELAEKIEAPDFVARAEVTGGYLNFFYDRKFYAESVLQMLGKARDCLLYTSRCV